MRYRDYNLLDVCSLIACLASLLILTIAFGASFRKGEKDAEEEIWRRVSATAVLYEEAPTRVDTLVFITDHLTPWQELILAIAYTESRFNPQAVGKAHDSGVLQLTPIYIREVNRVAGTDYQLGDAFDIEKAVEIFSKMQEHYNPEHDLEKAIRLHNRSPYYRREVLKNLEFIKQMEDVREAVKK